MFDAEVERLLRSERKMGAASKARWDDPAARETMVAAMKKAGERRRRERIRAEARSGIVGAPIPC